MDFRGAAREGPAARAQAGARPGGPGAPALRRPFRHQRQYRSGLPADHCRVSRVRYSPARSAPVVQALVDAGAIPIGKTNMDQFATGLVGTRSPHGACSSVFDARYISGGSSSGSAVAVASGLASFALGTDTAGSGRVPAAFNGLVGSNPRAASSARSGVVPACRTLDCVSIFVADLRRRAHRVDRGARASTRKTVSREFRAPAMMPRRGWPAGSASACRRASQLEFFGDDAAAALYAEAVRAHGSAGRAQGRDRFLRFSAPPPTCSTRGRGLPSATPRSAHFIEAHADEMNPVVRGIIEGARRYSAADAFEAEYQLRDLRRAAEAPVGAHGRPAAADDGHHLHARSGRRRAPVRSNTNLGYYTNFVNLLDLAAVAVPAGLRANGLPFGVSLIGPAFSDERCCASRIASTARRPRAGDVLDLAACPPGCIAVAVVGAHLSGQPLNQQLTRSRQARLVKTCRTAPGYRLYALDGTMPPKPGLVRDQQFRGPGIEVEVWAMPEHQFGGFVAGVPAPLGIGNAVLDDGATREVASSANRTRWRAPRKSRASAAGGITFRRRYQHDRSGP